MSNKERPVPEQRFFVFFILVPPPSEELELNIFGKYVLANVDNALENPVVIFYLLSISSSGGLCTATLSVSRMTFHSS